MMKNPKHKLIIKKIKEIQALLESTQNKEEDVYSMVIDSISVIEHILKEKLYRKNKLLIYNFSISDMDKTIAILKEKKNSLHTIEIREALERYKKLFPKAKFSKNEASIEILRENRNQLEHGINIKNMGTKEDLLGVVASIFPIILEEVKNIVGDLSSLKIKKPEKTYSEKDIQSIYENLVLSKIKNYNQSIHATYEPLKLDVVKTEETPRLLWAHTNNNLHNPYETVWANNFNTASDLCPRCSNYSISKNRQSFSLGLGSNLYNKPDLYICSSCNLELTDLEYEAVKKLRKEGKL